MNASLRRQLAVIALAAVGIRVWESISWHWDIGATRWALIAGAAGIACLGSISRIFENVLNRFRHPSRRMMNRNAIGIAIVATAYLIFTAFAQQRPMCPTMHDECSYAIGTHILARGRLWMPPLPLPDFFDSFYILVRPVYGSIYFVGGAMLFVPSVWLHLPIWLMPTMVAGAAVGMMYRVLGELTDGVGGALAALMTTSLVWFRAFSVALTGHIPTLLMGLVLFYAWLRWRESHRIRWAIVMGVAAGWAAVTRPADAAIYAAPIGVATLISLFRLRPRNGLRGLAAMILAAAPFLAVQVVSNIGATGHALGTAYTRYLSEDMPGSNFGFYPFDPNAVPVSTVTEKREFYRTWVQPHLAAHTVMKSVRNSIDWNVPIIIDTTIPCRLLLVFAPIGFLGLSGSRRWALWFTAPLFVLVYAINPFFLDHYALLIIPALTLMILLSGQAIASSWPRYQRQINAAFTAMIVMICITSTWEVSRLLGITSAPSMDEVYPAPLLKYVNAHLPGSVEEPAVVLFAFHTGEDFIQEQVYNMDVAWPDDAPVIRAHDLGPERNRLIFDYYAKIQPERVFYSFDFDRRVKLIRLGTARNLATR